MSNISENSEKGVRCARLDFAGTVPMGNDVATKLLSKAFEEYDKLSASILDKKSYGTVLPHPIDRMKAMYWQDMCAPHNTCVLGKANCTVGLGFISNQEAAGAESESEQVGLYSGDVAQFVLDPSYIPTQVDEKLDGLCDVSFSALLMQVEQSAQGVGDGYIEVRRESEGGRIVGLHYIEPQFLWKVMETTGNYHYRYMSYDKEAYLSRFGSEEHSRVCKDKNLAFEDVSEVIEFPFLSSKSRYYGYPDWVSCVPAMELYLAALQEKFDDYRNRCVMDFLLFITGKKLQDKEWKAIVSGISSSSGIGNAHKSMAINLPYSTQEMDIKFFPVTKEAKSDEGFSKMFEDCRSEILSAHGMPPLLAGVLIPGKLGASNEFVNALMCIQSLKIGPRQKLITRVLQSTLGKKSEGFGIDPVTFNLRKITDYINMGVADTASRMRESVTEASAKGRDLTEGLKD